MILCHTLTLIYNQSVVAYIELYYVKYSDYVKIKGRHFYAYLACC